MDNRNTLDLIAEFNETLSDADKDSWYTTSRDAGCWYFERFRAWFLARPAPEASPPAPGKHCASCYCGRRAPVQRDWNKTPEAKPAGHISWEEHLEVYAKYAAQYGTSQSAERMAERGGFGYGEIIMLMGVAPKTWLPGEAPKTPPPAQAPAPGREGTNPRKMGGPEAPETGKLCPLHGSFGLCPWCKVGAPDFREAAPASVRPSEAEGRAGT